MIQLCDFGLCCESGSARIYVAQTSRMLPIRWLAIESITENIFSEKSDVYVSQMLGECFPSSWSFGVLLYEIYSLGLEPYEGISVLNVKENLQKGERLGRPKFASETM